MAVRVPSSSGTEKSTPVISAPSAFPRRWISTSEQYGYTSSDGIECAVSSAPMRAEETEHSSSGRTEEAPRLDDVQIEVGLDAGLGGDDRGDGVHRVHRRPDAAPVTLVAGGVLLARFEGDVQRRVTFD